MTNITMWDAITVENIPSGATCVAGYVSGRWPTAVKLAAMFPHARLLTIATSASHDADALDIEAGDATPADAADWYGRQRARGVARPGLYASAGRMQAEVVPVLRAASILRGSVRLWSAHYTHELHICGPSSCGEMSISADGTQFTDRAMNRDLDESLLLSDFFASSPAPSPTPTPATGWETAMLATLPTLTLGANDANLPHWYVHRVQAIVNAVYRVSPAVAVDGAYGPATAAAVEQVQRQAGITADGTVGPATWSVLVTGATP